MKASAMTEVSVITLGRGRPDHMRNLVLGLTRQTALPAELVVGVMQADLYDLPEAPFPIRQIRVEGDALPLAAARNTAARAAVSDKLVFLDMDCIPGPDLVSLYDRRLDEFDGLLMGEVLYLPGGATREGWRTESFDAVGVKHSDRYGPPQADIEPCDDYRCFWSLNFAMRRDTFFAGGGFDEQFVGYGAEDTDFAKGLWAAGVPIAWVKGGLAYHQYHPHFMPPVHHIDSVVRNAELFEAKWGYRTMGHWLYAFRLMGLVDDTPGRPIRILRRPDAADHALTGQESHQPYANTASVIRRLKAADPQIAA